jgi:hypothetical protein
MHTHMMVRKTLPHINFHQRITFHQKLVFEFCSNNFPPTGCRMRALQIDPLNGEPEPYAQNCFYLCAYSIMVQALLVVFLPFLVPGVTCKQGLFEGDITYEGLTGWVATLLVS